MNENNFYVIWGSLEERYRTEGDVVCFIPLVGYYGWRHSEIVKVHPKSREGSTRLPSGMTYQPCTNSDLAELQSAIDMGIGQIILHPYHVASEPLLLMYGTGKTGTDPVYKRATVQS